MRSIRRNVAITAALLTFTGGLARADSLVTTDGDMLMGTVKKTAAGYTIQTADGPVSVAADKVKRVLYDHPPAAAAAAPAASVEPAKPAAKPVDTRSVNLLITQGLAAMAAGEYRDAIGPFTDATSIDAKNPTANRGLGFANLKIGGYAPAVKPLEMAALGMPLDRSLTMALAAALTTTHNPMRAVKYIQTYFDAHPVPADEPMLNALGISLAMADSSATKSDLYAQAETLYFKLNTDLESTQPGKRRWGIEWLPADVVNEKVRARQAAKKVVDDAETALQAANLRVTTAKSDLDKANNTGGKPKKRQSLIDQAQAHLTAAQDDQQKAQTAYDDANKALAEAPGPNFPGAVSLEGVDLSMTPVTAIASAAPVVPPARASAHRPSVPSAAAVSPVHVDDTPVAPPQVATAAAIEVPKNVTRYGVAFAIAPDLLVTADSVVDGASDIKIESATGGSVKAEVLRAHAGDGLAILKVKDANFPCLAIATSMSSGALSCLSFPQVDLFNPLPKQMPVMSSDPAEGNWTVRFDISPRLPGGPLLKDGAVVGVELTDRNTDPAAVPAETLKELTSLVNDDAKPGQQVAKDPRQAVVQVEAEH